MNEDEVVLTGVISANGIAWESVYNEICLDCEAIFKDIEEDETLDEDAKQDELDCVECFDHKKLIGDWLKDEKGLYYPDENGEYAAIVTSSTFNCVQVVWSKYITEVRAMCSPCFPNQADLDSGKGNIKCYDLPEYMKYSEEVK